MIHHAADFRQRRTDHDHRDAAPVENGSAGVDTPIEEIEGVAHAIGIAVIGGCHHCVRREKQHVRAKIDRLRRDRRGKGGGHAAAATRAAAKQCLRKCEHGLVDVRRDPLLALRERRGHRKVE